MIKKDVVVIGAGAAGLMCAIEAGKRGRSVLVLEHMDKIGRKISVSGGGRCNFTNTNLGPGHYLSSNPHFCKSALARFTPRDFIDMVERHGISYYEKEEGQLFCRGDSGDIIRMLREECSSCGVEIGLRCRISGISRAGRFRLSTNLCTIDAASLVVATGGLSYPCLGATGAGFGIAKQFGLKVTKTRPGLVPFVFSQGEMKEFGELSGISLDALVRCNDIQFRGRILFTHRGLSGPAILQASSYWDKGDRVIVDLMPDADPYALFITRHSSRIGLANLLSQYLPRKFSHKWCELYSPPLPLCRYNEKELRDISHLIHNWALSPSGTEGYKRAEITAGGVDTDELSSKTMESKKVPGLFFAGEVVDVAGQLGGYNLQWAWSSGFAAGQYA